MRDKSSKGTNRYIFSIVGISSNIKTWKWIEKIRALFEINIYFLIRDHKEL